MSTWLFFMSNVISRYNTRPCYIIGTLDNRCILHYIELFTVAHGYIAIWSLLYIVYLYGSCYLFYTVLISWCATIWLVNTNVNLRRPVWGSRQICKRAITVLFWIRWDWLSPVLKEKASSCLWDTWARLFHESYHVCQEPGVQTFGCLWFTDNM